VFAFPLFSTFSTLHDALHSTAVLIARDVLLSLAVVFWLSLAFWVLKDARRRIDHPVLVGAATLVGLVPFLGPLVYLLFRPSETLGDVRAREAELLALEQQLARVRPTCPVCSSATEPDYLVCPVCATRLRQPCPTCEAPLEPLWQVCPYCAHAVAAEPAHDDLDAALTGELRTIAQDGPAPPAPTPLHQARTADG
jgi:Double zinc ribbon